MTKTLFNINESDTKDSVLWTKEKILSKIGQEEIFEHYLGIPVTYRGHFKSPIRKDENPTCSFTWRNGKLLFRDWSEPRAKDCFNIVEELHNVDYYTALEIVAKDFDLTDAKPRDGISTTSYSMENYKREKNNEKSIIEVKRQPLTKDNIEYLKSYHLTQRIIDYYNVYSVKHVWLNGRMFYTYTEDKPALAYYFGTDEKGRQKWKIYYYRSRDSWRFIGNTNRINGWIQIPEQGENLIITKSLKDVMCLARFKIPAIAMQSENQIPYDYIIEELEERFDNIYTLLDFDRVGVRTANIIKRLYGIRPLFFTDGRFGSHDFEQKDFSDYLQEKGVESTAKLIKQVIPLIGKHKLFPKLN